MFLKMIMEYVSQKSTKTSYPTKTISELSVTKACSFVGISRQAHYKQCIVQSQHDNNEEYVLNFVMAERIVQPRIGTR